MTTDAPAYPNRPLRLMLVDDHDLFRTGLRTLLEETGHKVMDVSHGAAAVRLARSFRPHVVVMDMNMPETSGIEAARLMLAEHPDVAILMLTITADEDSVLDAVRAGASGYLLKDAALPEILAGIEAAAAGHSAISPRVASALVASVRDAATPEPSTPVTPLLSARERTVLALLANGYENIEIAERLFVSPSTVKNHVSRLFEKLGVDNRVRAAAFAIRHGLADLERVAPVAVTRPQAGEGGPQRSHGRRDRAWRRPRTRAGAPSPPRS
jgi:DNA-binding NarL/FixJ family response regulator